ncbi:uncharacterized protein AMSG_04457 [Thecamonas trahens ATCC 50062]|uniref:Uncharacterized protein n=1 Tax=Thecamonas trahens ATCC 50062 TaxID=461836 RepID=A0A0L0D771_THETB|nr:hypothetical protein AMSG_04457 [Thecamonas trahens ATCC 50062]KNC48227.1 hypothetical protein AMSG_04457 [Thecamonas trahens ATCC 50062]|eukprot:XP_013758796.1 hypothetical protein AMSG_04457 [Thecamonas trahens ATCC 50062]
MSAGAQVVQLACLAQCLFCGSYFLPVVASYAPAAFRGKGKRKAEEAHVAEIHTNRCARSMYDEIQCPMCASMASHGMSYLEWLDSREPSTDVIVRFPRFGHPPPGMDAADTLPLYANKARCNVKPKFKLVEGIGPEAIELDRSRSNTVFAKSTLAGCGVDIGPDAFYQLEPGTHFYTRPIIERIMAAVRVGMDEVAEAGGDVAGYFDHAAAALFQYAPIFGQWDEVSPILDDLVAP